MKKNSDLVRRSVSTILAVLGVIGIIYFSCIGLFGGYPHFYMWIMSFVAAAVVAIVSIWPGGKFCIEHATRLEKVALITITFDIIFVTFLLFGFGGLQAVVAVVLSIIWHWLFIEYLKVSDIRITDEDDVGIVALFVAAVVWCYCAILFYDEATAYQKEVNNFYEQPFHKINRVECSNNKVSGVRYVYTEGGEKLVFTSNIYTFYIEGGKKLTFSDGLLDVSAGDSIRYRFISHDIISSGLLHTDFLYEIKRTR